MFNAKRSCTLSFICRRCKSAFMYFLLQSVPRLFAMLFVSAFSRSLLGLLSRSSTENHPFPLHTLQAALDKELEEHCRDQRAALASRLRKRKAAKKESLRRAGAGEEETAAAMQALDFDSER